MNRTLETPRSFLSESTLEFMAISPELAELNITEIMHMTAAGIPTLLMKWIMSLDTIPDKIDDWYSKAIHFQNQWDCTEQIAQQSRRSTQTFQSFSSSPRMTKDSNAMDVDAVKLKKLTPEEQEDCFKKRLCL